MAQTKRDFLKGVLSIGCCAAASPLLTPVTVAAAPGENRLVVIILRGAMDGLGVAAPYGDPDYAALRPKIGRDPEGGLIDMDGRFGMHPKLAPLAPLWQAGEVSFAHAVSTPYRDKRSHFDGQDILEAGTAGIASADNGWINRALSHMTGTSIDTAYSVGRENMLITTGPNPARSWAPGARLPLGEDERALLQMIYAKDPLFAEAVAAAADLSLTSGKRKAQGAKEAEVLAKYAAERLNEQARIAAFSIGGWDTHVAQPAALNRPVIRLASAITTLKDKLGGNWSRTLVVAMTEFGRTARENGSKGTDHGTGGAALLAGGALRGGRIYADWPGLGQNDLYKGRDLTPTEDVRHYPAWALHTLFGIEKSAIVRDVFPGLSMGANRRFIA